MDKPHNVRNMSVIVSNLFPFYKLLTNWMLRPMSIMLSTPLLRL